MSTCYSCKEEITFKRVVGGRAKGLNMDGTPHNCKSPQAQAAQAIAGPVANSLHTVIQGEGGAVFLQAIFWLARKHIELAVSSYIIDIKITRR